MCRIPGPAGPRSSEEGRRWAEMAQGSEGRRGWAEEGRVNRLWSRGEGGRRRGLRRRAEGGRESFGPDSTQRVGDEYF